MRTGERGEEGREKTKNEEDASALEQDLICFPCEDSTSIAGMCISHVHIGKVYLKRALMREIERKEKKRKESVSEYGRWTRVSRYKNTLSRTLRARGRGRAECATFLVLPSHTFKYGFFFLTLYTTYVKRICFSEGTHLPLYVHISTNLHLSFCLCNKQPTCMWRTIGRRHFLRGRW